MRRRIGGVTGMGNPDPVVLDNKGKLNKEFADEMLTLYFSEWEGYDFKVTKKSVAVGIEPSYQYEKLRILYISKDKGESYVWYGKAFGPYGSQIVGKKKFYKDYKLNSKFKRVVDKFHPILFKE